MYILLFFLWLIFAGQLTLEVIIFGLIITTLIALLMKALFDYNLKKDLMFIKKVPGFLRYLGILIVEIVKAGINMIKIILDKSIKVDPVIVTFHSGLKTKMGNFILANSITLTPGTITIKNEGDKFVVHCLDRSMLDTNKNSVFIKNIRELEGDING